MEKLLKVISAFMIIIFVTSCDSPSKQIDSQPVSDNTTQVADSSAVVESQTAEAGTVHNGDRGPRSGQRITGELTGQQIVENVSNKLNDKLNLTEEQHKNITEILSKNLTATGGSLEGKYPVETAKNMARDLRKTSATSISGVLTPEQSERFNKFMSK